MTFTIGTATLIHADCMDILRSLSDGEYDLAIVDPPYGIGVQNNFGVGNRNDKQKDSRIVWDNNIPSNEYFKELARVSVDQIVFGANYFNCFNGKHGAIIWDKQQPLPDSSQCEIASYSRLKKVGIYRQTWTNYVNSKQTTHPTEKPVKLYEWLLTTYAQPGQRILDTHLGSGSSAIAANNLGFTFTGIEIDGDYFQAAKARIEAAHRQEKLF